MNKLDKIFQFVIETCADFNIDESHGLKHSMDVLRYSEQIYKDELENSNILNQDLVSKYQVIVYAAALHDMCDHKYLVESYGIERIKKLLYIDLELDHDTIDLICRIILSMSYSKVKLNGFAKFDNQLDQLAYNIVREADLLTAYDFDRSVIYSIINKKMTWYQAVKDTVMYFEFRVLTQISDGLFVTNFGIKKAQELHNYVLTKVIL